MFYVKAYTESKFYDSSLHSCVLFAFIFFDSVVQIAKLQLSSSTGSELKWVEEFGLGSLIEGEVKETKNIGAVIRFKNYDDVFGFITPYQCKSLV